MELSTRQLLSRKLIGADVSEFVLNVMAATSSPSHDSSLDFVGDESTSHGEDTSAGEVMESELMARYAGCECS